jgi:nucleoside-specific outer membrane channel protein Tsx
LFVDQINYQGREDYNQGRSTYYGELQPRLSLGKLSGHKMAFGPVKLLAASYEFGEGDTESYLLGLASTWPSPASTISSSTSITASPMATGCALVPGR